MNIRSMPPKLFRRRMFLVKTCNRSTKCTLPDGNFLHQSIPSNYISETSFIFVPLTFVILLLAALLTEMLSLMMQMDHVISIIPTDLIWIYFSLMHQFNSMYILDRRFRLWIIQISCFGISFQTLIELHLSKSRIQSMQLSFTLTWGITLFLSKNSGGKKST